MRYESKHYKKGDNMYIKHHHFEIDPREQEPYTCTLKIAMTEKEREENLNFMDVDIALLDMITSIREQLLLKIAKESKHV